MKTPLFMLLLLLTCKIVFSQNQITDSLTHQLANAKSDTMRVLIYEKLMNTASARKAAVNYGQQGFALAKQIRYTNGVIRCGNGLGFKLVELDYYKAIPVFMEIKQLCEKQHDQARLANTVMGLGYAYNKFDFKKAQAYYRQVKPLMIKAKLSERDIPITTILGQFYNNWGLADSALFYLHKGYQLALTGNNSISPKLHFIQFGKAYYKKGQSSLAMTYFRRAIATGTGKPNGQAFQGIALIFRDRQQLDSARFYAKESLRLQQESNQTIYIIETANLLFDLYKTTHPAEALNYHLIASATKDSLFNQEKARQVEKLAFEERENEARLQRRIEAHQLAYQNQVKVYGLSSVLLGLSLFAFFLYRNNHQKQRANRLLQRQRDEIQAQRTQLQTALTDLRTTQNQLIQREKMASLGELTAGIAHEIQNPLNFVNNFSEVSVELIEEQKEALAKGDTQEATFIANDLVENLQRITQNGQRASNIVRGMLEHSRTSTGERLPTDLNDLADEYLQLAYQGMRAKDNTINCKLETHFDLTLPLVPVVAQDISRVMLNLFNNAFYAVGQKQKTAPADYPPTVWVSTAHGNGAIEIRVRDNGGGIPEAIREKIFQPFFTTKPTGEGTGLGLSLSYDIVTKGHGGEMIVESREGEGAAFTVKLAI